MDPKDTEVTYTSRILTALIEQRKSVNLLFDRVISLENTADLSSKALTECLNNLNTYISQVNVLNTKVDNLTNLVEDNLKTVNLLVSSTGDRKSLVERFEQVEDWVTTEKEKLNRFKEERSKFVLNILGNLIPALTLIVITFIGGVLVEYFVNYPNRVKFDTVQPSIVEKISTN